MKSRIVGFAILVGLTLCAAFVAWNVAQMSFIPAAVQAAHERGERLPAYQILGVDLASYRLVWVLWSVGAVGAYWWLMKRERKTPVGLLVFSGFSIPLILTSALLIGPLLF